MQEESKSSIRVDRIGGVFVLETASSPIVPDRWVGLACPGRGRAIDGVRPRRRWALDRGRAFWGIDGAPRGC